MSDRIVVPLEQSDEESFPGVGSPERLKEIRDAALSALKDFPETNQVYIEIHAAELLHMTIGLHRELHGRYIDEGGDDEQFA